MIKTLLLQQWYNLSDPQVEREIRDRISFMNFLGYPEKLSDRNKIWYFRKDYQKRARNVWYSMKYGIRSSMNILPSFPRDRILHL